MKKFLRVLCSLMLITKLLSAQTDTDSGYLKKIDSIETKIQQIKSLPKEQQKQYNADLSDVENRKNTLKSLLKTPLTKRDKTWEETWTRNYNKASDKLKNIQLK